MNGRHGGISGLDRMFGRFCGGFDEHGRELSELGYDRDHNREQNGFCGMFGSSSLFDDF